MIITFCGHREIYNAQEIEKELYRQVEILAKQGADEFLLGGYGEFDMLCAKVVKELKKTYPHINSVIVLPYPDRKYDTSLYDASEYPDLENIPKKIAILKRNEYMVDKSDILIAYVTYTFGGAHKTLQYARKKGKKIIEILL